MFKKHLQNELSLVNPYSIIEKIHLTEQNIVGITAIFTFP